MLRAIVSAALKVRFALVALALIALFGGPALLRNVPLDVFPEFAPPLVEIQTEAPGLSAEEVESLVTVPLENAVNGVSWLETLRSKSVLGLSSVKIIFERGTDLMAARQLVQERMDLTAELANMEDKPDLTALENDFVASAKAYGTRKGITYAAWRELGVDAATLKAAGITRAG